MENVYSDALGALLRDACTPAVVRDIEGGRSASTLWDALHESGFADSLLPDAGLSLADVLPMLMAMGQYALPLPLAQTMFARAVLHAAGHEIPAGPIALATLEDVPRTHVADGASAAWFLVQRGDVAWLLARDDATMQSTGVHGDLTVSIAGKPSMSFPLPHGLLRTIGATLHTALMAGAMSRVFDLTLQYANDRTQFGRSIGKFQAIQHQISTMAEQVAAVRMAAQIACSGEGWQPDRMHAAIGKFNASDAVTSVSAAAHAVHGALGITAEYDLQLFTRRLHAWRMADGSERYWAREIGTVVCETEMQTVDQIRRWAGETASTT